MLENLIFTIARAVAQTQGWIWFLHQTGSFLLTQGICRLELNNFGRDFNCSTSTSLKCDKYQYTLKAKTIRKFWQFRQFYHTNRFYDNNVEISQNSPLPTQLNSIQSLSLIRVSLVFMFHFGHDLRKQLWFVSFSHITQFRSYFIELDLRRIKTFP